MDQVVARCTVCDAEFHYVSQKNRTFSCRCGAPLKVYELPVDRGSLMATVARSTTFPPAPLRLPRWRIA